jgi:transcriptional regulator with XRE-family HTH domain
VSVNEKIRLIRETKGFTQEQVAEKLGVSPSSYGDIERGENDPKLSKLEKIAEILGVRLSELVDSSEKGSLNINFNKGEKNTIYIGVSAIELEKQQLIIKLKDKELALKDKEIELKNEKINDLSRIIALLENIKIQS